MRCAGHAPAQCCGRSRRILVPYVVRLLHSRSRLLLACVVMMLTWASIADHCRQLDKVYARRATRVAPMESSPLRILAVTHCDATEGCTFARIVTPLHALQSTGRVIYKHVRIMPWSVAAFW